MSAGTRTRLTAGMGSTGRLSVVKGLIVKGMEASGAEILSAYNIQCLWLGEGAGCPRVPVPV